MVISSGSLLAATDKAKDKDQEAGKDSSKDEDLL